jgi:hypothetical protein
LKPEGRGQLARFGHRWEYNIKMDLKVMGCEDAKFIDLLSDYELLKNVAAPLS